MQTQNHTPRHSQESSPITLEDIQAARARLRPFLPVTALRSYPALDALLGLHVLIKHENHQPTNSFKVRNGLAALSTLAPEQREPGVVAATRGNHGLGLAWAGRQLGVRVTICVPGDNNPEKNEDIRSFGAELVEEGRDYDEAVMVMERLVHERGFCPVHSTNNSLVLAGAGTLTLEVLEQAEQMGEQIDAMVFAVGGGSQAVGAITALRSLRPKAVVYGVQAERASAIHDAWRYGHPTPSPRADTFADGIATRMTYELTFETLRQGLKDFVLVSENELAEAVRLLLRLTHNLAEGAGAAGLAGLRKLAPSLQGHTVAIALSGSNIDSHTLQRILCGEV